jgi:tRNA A-37 threonylcarbamoyl transferase component Bud32
VSPSTQPRQSESKQINDIPKDCHHGSTRTEIKNISENGTSSLQIKNNNGFGIGSHLISRKCLTDLIESPESLFQAEDSKIIKQGRTAQVICCRIQSEEQTFQAAYKRICRKNILKAITGLFQQNRALTAFRAGELFLKKGIPTPKPIAAIVPSNLSWKQKGYLAVEWLENSKQLDQLCQDILIISPQERKFILKKLANQLGNVIGRMHVERISHHDLKAANILIKETPQEMKCFLIDLDGVETTSKLNNSTRFKNLARLNTTSMKQAAISLTDRCRFIKAYSSLQTGEYANWKYCWKQTLKQTR